MQIIEIQGTPEQVQERLQHTVKWGKAQECLDLYKRVVSVMNDAGQSEKAAQQAESGRVLAFLEMKDAPISLEAKCIATADIINGQVSFPKLPPGDYHLYGTGHAGRNVVLYFSSLKLKDGQSISLTPNPFFDCLVSTSSRSTASQMAGWVDKFKTP